MTVVHDLRFLLSFFACGLGFGFCYTVSIVLSDIIEIVVHWRLTLPLQVLLLSQSVVGQEHAPRLQCDKDAATGYSVSGLIKGC